MVDGHVHSGSGKAEDYDPQEAELKPGQGAPPDAQEGCLPGTGGKQTAQEQAGDHDQHIEQGQYGAHRQAQSYDAQPASYGFPRIQAGNLLMIIGCIF
jgi:hypothetical protein